MTKQEVLQKIKEVKENNSTYLSLQNSKLTELPPEIGQLTNLKYLYLIGNKLTELPPEIGQLTNLRELYLDGNKLTELPPEIGQLTNLQILHLNRNKLTELPPNIGQLKNLQRLNLDEDQLEKFANKIIQLKNIQFYIFDGERYKTIPSEFLAKAINGQELVNYYLLLKKGGRELNEAKILVVGQGSVGKTSLIKRLINGKYNPNENKTDGIDIYKNWKVSVNNREVQLNVWDFGGQEIMHATHQFFLTKRSLYILVLDSRLDKDENRIEYWLEKIKSLAGDSPIIVVGNKIDQHPLDINETGLMNKYPNIKGFYPVSCETKKNLAKLKDDLIKEIGKLSGIHDVLPETWFKVKEHLEKNEKDYIPYETYAEVCNEIGIDEKDYGKLIRLLHDIGIVLNFRDDNRLSDTNVLNPEWVTQGVYKILTSNELFKKKGVLQRTALSDMLDTSKYPKHKQMFIIEMMQKFELCFDIEPNEKFLIPALLDENELYTGDWKDSLKFQYHYKVFFTSIITRFIVKMHENISQETLWRTGVVLAYKNGDKILNRALVKADTANAERKIYISVDGNVNTRREFLSRIRAKFEEIHNTFKGDYVKDNIMEKVPVPSNPEIVVDYKHLRNLEDAGRKFVIPEGMIEEIEVKYLLNGIETPQERLNTEIAIVTTQLPNIQKEISLSRKNELEPIKAGIDGKIPLIWIGCKVLLAIPIFISLYYLAKWVYDNWEKINPHLQSAQIIWGIIIAIILGLILWIVGGKEVLKSIVKRTSELREEAMKSIAYKWCDFPIDEYKEICKELEKEKPKELVK